MLLWIASQPTGLVALIVTAFVYGLALAVLLGVHLPAAVDWRPISRLCRPSR